MERSFTEDVKQLGYGAGQILHGEGILAITKALLESGVSYVGGYPGAPVSHLIDVLADANEPLLKPMGVYFEQSGSEAAAAALLGASINYPMRGAATWKSVVGTNVASDALSHVASAGVIGGALIVIGEDYGEGASILQERTHSSALKSSVPLLDPRNTLPCFQRFVQEGFGLSEACHEPVFFSIRIRACHLRGTMVCRDNVIPAISRLSPLDTPSFSIERINLPSEPRIISLLVPAVGGQGGGVLAEWVVEAALADGYLVQSTSIPGVAQRTGSTSYYMELFADDDHSSAATPVFSLYPVPGDLDVLLAPELLEVGRAIELGFASPARTTIIASSHRLYSIHEKIVTGRGIYPAEDLLAAARAFSRTLIAFDALALAREHGTEANAVLLGALAASEVLPVSEAAYRKAIEAKGVQVAANLKGFDVGPRASPGRIVDGLDRAWRRWPQSRSLRRSPRRLRRRGVGAPGAPPRRGQRSPGPSDRLSGHQVCPSLPRAPGALRGRRRGTGPTRRAPAGGVDDLRGRHSCGPAQDTAEPVRAHSR